LAAVAAVRPALGPIGRAAEEAAARLETKGRLIYIGAGTSGRIAVQDGAELTPTFDWPRDRLVFVIAGGPGALIASVEGAEDDVGDAIRQIDEAGIGADDVAIGLAASGSTPFTIAALKRAGKRGALAIGVANNAGSPLLSAVRHPILVETGSEAVAGSTRMKAGTAQKVVLNLLSTAIMIRLGRVYRGMMVNMQTTNAKLRHRAETMVAFITGRKRSESVRALDRAGGDIKLASIMVFGFDRDMAEAILDRHGGSLRRALADMVRAETAAPKASRRTRKRGLAR
jgi:N-acetylmuramic acid 6-phosphate etherase